MDALISLLLFAHLGAHLDGPVEDLLLDAARLLHLSQHAGMDLLVEAWNRGEEAGLDRPRVVDGGEH